MQVGIYFFPLALCFGFFAALGARSGWQQAESHGHDPRSRAAKVAFLFNLYPASACTGLLLFGALAFGAGQFDALVLVLFNAGFYLFALNGLLAAFGAYLGAYLGPNASGFAAALSATLAFYLGPWTHPPR